MREGCVRVVWSLDCGTEDSVREGYVRVAWSLLGLYSGLWDDFRGQGNLKSRFRAEFSASCWELSHSLPG